MSGIAGVWNLDGRPLDCAVLVRMSDALSHRGSDGEGLRVTGAIGLASRHRWVTCEEIGEVQPLAGRAGVMLAMDGRIDNRQELLSALELPRSASDAACALAAFEAWDDRFAEHLNGDFAIAVFDANRQRLLLVRDAMGIRPLYYVHTDRLCAFASEIKALLAHPDIPARPDDEGIADFLLVGSRPLDRQSTTCFGGVSALVPAHLAVVTPTRLVTRRYWDFDTGRSVRFSSFGEYVEAFHERFAEALRRRLRSAYPVAISVSGGLDSSSILCQAETELRGGIASCPQVVGLSYTGAEGTDADERQYLSEIQRTYGIQIEQFPIAPFSGIVQRIEEQVCAVEAPFIDNLWDVTSELHQRAAARGARVLLTGHWGDQMLFCSGYLADLFRRLAWREVRRHLSEYSHYYGAIGARVLARRMALDIVRHEVPQRFVRPLKWARLRLFGVLRQRPWFSDRFLRQALRYADRPATIGHGFHSAHARAIYLEARSKYHVQCMEWNNKAGAAHALDAAFPFLDRDLVAFVMAVPGEIQNRNGVPRAILRESMRCVLPEPVRVRKSKADFTVVVNAGVAAGTARITRALSAESLAARLGYLDSVRLPREVARLSGRLTGSDCVDAWDLGDLLGFETWLQIFFGGRNSWLSHPSAHVQESVA